jgi:hypothetical protein
MKLSALERPVETVDDLQQFLTGERAGQRVLLKVIRRLEVIPIGIIPEEVQPAKPATSNP